MNAIPEPDQLELATESNFNEQAYLAANPDIARAVANGNLGTGWQHFQAYGRREGRKQLISAESCKPPPTDPAADRDRRFLHPDVPLPKIARHMEREHLILELGDLPGKRILEIGSRKVTSTMRLRDKLKHAEYVGFDYYPGANVDVVGDAHRLSSYFEQKFDFVYSSAVFEHLAMPWLVAPEIAKVMNVGGYLLLETHFSFNSHERPWHFFQFSDMALRCLFSPALGFDCLDAGMSNPIVARFSNLADEYLRNQPITGLYCHSEYLGIKQRDVTDFDWNKVDLQEVVGNTHYPPPKESQLRE